MREVYVFYLVVLGMAFSGLAAALWLAFVYDRRPHREKKGDKNNGAR